MQLTLNFFIKKEKTIRLVIIKNKIIVKDIFGFKNIRNAMMLNKTKISRINKIFQAFENLPEIFVISLKIRYFF